MEETVPRNLATGIKRDQRSIRVLFVIPDFILGGAGFVVSTYIRELDREHFDVGVCVWRGECDYKLPDAVPVWNVHKRQPWESPGCILRTARLLRWWQPDIVFSHLHFTNLITGLALRIARMSCHWVPCLHNDPENINAIWKNWAMRGLWQYATRVCTVSRGVAEGLQDRFNVPANKTKVIYNPIDFGSIDAALKTRRPNGWPSSQIVTVGRLKAQKDQATLLRAFAQLRQRMEARLTVVGSGPLQRELKDLATKLEIKDYVNFAGSCANPFPLIADADIFVLSSRWEGFGCVLAEAMGCGTACISTNCPYGPAEIIEDGESGLLVPVGDVSALAESIARLLKDKRMRTKLASAGNRRARRLFGLQRRVNALERLFKRIQEKPETH